MCSAADREVWYHRARLTVLTASGRSPSKGLSGTVATIELPLHRYASKERPLIDTPAAMPPESSWVGVEWGIVTSTGMLQARCRHPYGTPPRPCHAWRLSSPDGTAWRRCYTCGTDHVPLPIQAAGADMIATAVANAQQHAAPPTS